MSTAFFHRPRLIDYQRPAHELFTVAGLYGALDFRVSNLGEAKPTRFIGEPVSHHAYRASPDTLLLKPRRQIRFSCPIGKIANI